MTKTFEFIEQATIANQRRLEQYKRDLEYYEKESGPLIDYGAKIFRLKSDIKHVEEIVLPNLQQIKCELEAWEVFNNNVEIEEVEKINPFMQNTYKHYIIKEAALYESEVIKIKKAKALEVEDANM